MGAASVIYLSKECPQVHGIINQENNDLVALKDIKVRVMDFESPQADTYASCDLSILDLEDNNEVEIHFPPQAKIELNALLANNIKQDDMDMILYYSAGSNIGNISLTATDTTNAVKSLQRIMNKSYMFENGTDLVLELAELFKGNKIQLIHFEILVSQLMRDPDKIYYPYRYGPMTKPPKFIGIKQVPGIESSKRGVMFERILDVVQNEVLNGAADSDKRVKSDLETLFDI